LVSHIRFPVLCSLLLIAALCSCLGCGHTSPAPPDRPKGPKNEDTTLGPGDIFVVKVYQEPNLSGKYRVSAKGTIDFPLIGTVKVQGLRPPQVAKMLRWKLAKGYLKNPYVHVFVDTYQSKKISVFGSVRKPGTFNYINNMSIIEAITLAGGFTPLASKNKTTVTRHEKGVKKMYNLPVDDIGIGKAPNYLLQPGDVVFVPERVF